MLKGTKMPKPSYVPDLPKRPIFRTGYFHLGSGAAVELGSVSDKSRPEGDDRWCEPKAVTAGGAVCLCGI